jgi:hypothetical protein
MAEARIENFFVVMEFEKVWTVEKIELKFMTST